ncbi:hypothetical protein [uncultured Roseobacter sp.]|uniref:hypothetical protein n=1 Tax=uncultured Roseobacter sp. TaxID=114847 RepID=UPI0026232EA0|nr:hypothetical protein [uncultured Roseobacter sp.]
MSLSSSKKRLPSKTWVGGCTALALILSGSTAAGDQSRGVFYDCNMRVTKSNDFWVSNKIGIVVLNNGKVVVSDGVILGYGLSTVTAEVVSSTDNELRLKWQVEGGLREKNYILPDAQYTARIKRPSNQITVRGKLPGYRKNFSGKGQCTLRQE